MSLITISNRVALPSQLQGAQGGLAVGLRGALEDGGGLWFGWDGRHEPRLPDPRPLAVQNANGVRYATLRLTRAEYERFYLGFSNQVLWPLFHYRLPYVHCQRADREGYWAVNRLFADRLPDLPDAESPIWIHDYHFIPLGQMLRERGITNPLGFSSTPPSRLGMSTAHCRITRPCWKPSAPMTWWASKPTWIVTTSWTVCATPTPSR